MKSGTLLRATETLSNIIFSIFLDRMVHDISTLQVKIFSYCMAVTRRAKARQILDVWHLRLVHVWVLLGDPFDGTRGVVPGCFDPLQVMIHVGTLDTEFHHQTIPKISLQNTTTQ